MTDDLILICFILIFFDEISCTGKCDLIDIFFNLVSCHTKTIIGDGYFFVVRIYDDLQLGFIICG